MSGAADDTAESEQTVTGFDRFALWFFFGFIWVYLLLLQVGFIGPRWQVYLDSKLVADVPASAKVLDMPVTDEKFHVFELRSARQRTVTSLQIPYAWAGAGNMDADFAQLVSRAPGRALLIYDEQERGFRWAMQLACPVASTCKAQILLGTAVPTGGKRVHLL